MKNILAAFAFLFLCITSAQAQGLRIIAWNASPESSETVEDRISDLTRLNADLQPDVLVLIEVTDFEAVKKLAMGLGWPKYQIAMSDWARHSTSGFFTLETAIITKVPIERIVEVDASPDGTAIPVDEKGNELTSIPVVEVQLNTDGISGVSPVRSTDRGTLRVDLENGLSLFPVHLKSSRNGSCSAAAGLESTLRRLGFQTTPAGQALINHAENALASGFEAATRETLSSAVKRERVIAAVKLVAEEAMQEERRVVILGDFNTGLEPGKAGKVFADCTLSDFSCAKMPFPENACTGGDGFDDTLAILTEKLVGSEKWKLLSENLGRTFEDTDFADKAIDHIAVPESQQSFFSEAQKGSDTYGSDHFPVFVEMK